MEGSIVNQIEISGFSSKEESEKFRKKIKSIKSIFNLSKINKSLSFAAIEGSLKIKDDFSLVYIFITENSFPEEEIQILAEEKKELNIQHMIIAPSEAGNVMYISYSYGELYERKEVVGGMAKMLGDLILGGFQ
jgi:hypothetical protein